MIRTRRARADMPDSVRHEEWRLALDMHDQLAGLGAGAAVVAADADCGDNAQFRHGLPARGRAYVMQVDGELTAYAGDAVPEVKAYT